jgi:hypothetical protein
MTLETETMIGSWNKIQARINRMRAVVFPVAEIRDPSFFS